MSKTAKTALGGIIAAISVIVMMLTVVPVLTYAAPMFAGLILMLIVIEIDKKWAFGIYAVVAVLSCVLATDKEAAVMYTAFFGYYPILKGVIEGHLKNKFINMIIKLIVFNAAIVASYFVMIYVLGLPIEGLSDFGKWTIPIFLVAGNAIFIFYDTMFLSTFVRLYVIKWQAKFRKLFNKKNNGR